jgi:hypothetical protein
MANKKKYIVTMHFDIYADNDTSAIKLAEFIRKTHDKKYDNRPHVLEIEAMHGFNLRKIK